MPDTPENQAEYPQPWSQAGKGKGVRNLFLNPIEENALRRYRDAAIENLEQGFDADELAAVTANLQAAAFANQSPWHQDFADVAGADHAFQSDEALPRSILDSARRDADQDYRDAVAIARRQLGIDRDGAREDARGASED